MDTDKILKAAKNCPYRKDCLTERQRTHYDCPVLEAMEPEYELHYMLKLAQGWKIYEVRIGLNPPVGWVMVHESGGKIYGLSPNSPIAIDTGHFIHTVGEGSFSRRYGNGSVLVDRRDGAWASRIDTLLEKEKE